MAKEELIEFEGLVTEILPDTRYRVKLDTGHEIIAYTARVFVPTDRPEVLTAVLAKWPVQTVLPAAA